MDFVVPFLREDVGMEETEVIRRKAQGQHPLVCRAVQASTADVG